MSTLPPNPPPAEKAAEPADAKKNVSQAVTQKPDEEKAAAKPPDKAVADKEAAIEKEQKALLAELDQKSAEYEKSKPREKKNASQSVTQKSSAKKQPDKKPAAAKKDASHAGTQKDDDTVIGEKRSSLTREIMETIEKNQQVENIHRDKISAFPGHPFKIIENDPDMIALINDIRANGIQEPISVIKNPEVEGQYIVFAGHRRLFAAEKVNMTHVPALVKPYTLEQAAHFMYTSNTLRRQIILPSETAGAFKVMFDTRKKAAGRNANPQKERTDQIIADELGISRREFHQYKSLTNLIPELMQRVDNFALKLKPQMAVLPASELAALPHAQQRLVLSVLERLDATPSHKQATELKKLSKDKNASFDKDNILGLLEQEKPNQAFKISMPATAKINSYFSPEDSIEHIDATLCNAMDTRKKVMEKLAEKQYAKQPDAAQPTQTKQSIKDQIAQIQEKAKENSNVVALNPPQQAPKPTEPKR